MGDRLSRKLERRPRASFDFVSQGRFQKAAELQRLRVRARAPLHARLPQVFCDALSANGMAHCMRVHVRALHARER